MAFDLSTWQTAKYRFSFVGDEGTSYIAEIHEDGHDNHTDDATADDLTTIESVGRDAVQVTWAPDGENEYAPMYFSEATLQFYDGSEAIAGDLIGALNTVDDKYLVVIRQGNNLKWVGNIDPEGITYEEDGAIPLTISAVDGLGRLANRPYISATDGTAADEGATTLIAAIADCLNDTGFGLDFYVSSSMYHKTSPALGATANPLENTWVNKLAFVAKKSTGDQAVTSKLSVLTEICAAFGLRCFQAEGAWHLVQVNHFATSSYRRWRYDSTGAGKVTDSNAPNDYEDIDPRVTISNEDIIRTVATKTFLKGYNSSAVSYEHGPIQILRAPRFEPQDQLEANQFFGGGNTYPWSSAANAFLYLLNDGTWGMSVDSIDADGSAYTGYAEIAVSDVRAKIANAAGTGVGTLDAAIGSTYKSTQRSQQELQTGASIVISADAYCKSYGANPPADWWTYTDTYIAIQVKHYGSSTQYLEWGSDGSLDWTTTANWLLLKNQSNLNGWLHIALQQIETIPSDGDIEVSLGPIISDETSQGIFERVVWDNVQVSPVLADGTINHETTTSLNFIDRSQPRPVRRSVILGDGPTSYNKGSMFSDSTLDTITQDWEETTTGHSGTDTNVDHATLLGTMMLTSMNKIRPVHNAAYPGLGQILTPLDTLNRGGSYYPAWQITANYQREMSSGAWYLADENVFSNDLETGVSSGSHLVSDFGRGSSGVEGFNFNRIGSSFDTLIARESDRLATVNAAATSGTTVTCTALAYALNAGDPVFFQSKKTGYIMKRIVAANAAASATSFTVTSAFSASEPLNVGDPILPGSISGLRIDMSGVEILNTHIYGGSWDGTVDGSGNITAIGTQGWIITGPGKAEFHDVLVRGTIKAGTLPVWIGKDVNGDANLHGIYINSENYWTVDEDAANVVAMRVGDYSGGQYIDWDGSNIDISASGATSKIEFTSGNNVTKIQNGLISIVNAVSSHSISVVGGAFSVTTSGSNGSYAGTGYQAGAGVSASFLAGTGNITIGTASGTLNFKLSGSATLTMPTADGTSGQVLQTNGSGTLSWVTPSSGVTTFLGLTDTPSSFAGTGTYFVKVNSGATALEFVANPGYITAAVTSVSGAGSVDGLTLSGTVTSTGNITLSGSIAIAATQVTSGTIASARISGSYTGITGTGALSAGSITTGFGTIATANTISTTSKIYVGGSTFATDGIQLDYNGGNPRFYVGDGASSYFQFDGTTATLNGGLVTNIAGGSEVAIQGWQATMAFSATDADTVAWGAGTLTLMDGTSYSIGAGNTGNMVAKTYIYLDIATSTTALQTTTTASTAVGGGKILIAVAQNTTTEAKFQVFGGSGGVLVTADEIAANSITANEIAANTITASEIAASTITGSNIAAGTITASNLSVTSLDAITATMGNLTISGTLQTSGYSAGGGVGVLINTSKVEVSAAGSLYIKMDAGLLSAVGPSGTTSLSSTTVSSNTVFGNTYVQAGYLRLDDIAAPGGTANIGTLFADASEVLQYYKGTAGPYTVWHSGNDGAGSGLDADTVDGVQLSGLLQTSAIGTTVQAYDAFLSDVATDLGAASGTNQMIVHAPSVGSPTSGTAWQFRDAVYMANVYSTENGPVFVGGSLETSSGDTPATPTGTTFLGWLHVNVGGTAGRLAVYNST